VNIGILFEGDLGRLARIPIHSFGTQGEH